MRLGLTAMLAVGLATGAVASDVRVVDGDTLELEGEKIRLYGIDAPEAGQSCTKPGAGTWACGKAAIALVECLVALGEFVSDDRGRDDYGRTLAVCTAGGVELNRALVDAGLAWSFRRYANGYDDADERRTPAASASGAQTRSPLDSTGRTDGMWLPKRRRRGVRSR